MKVRTIPYRPARVPPEEVVASLEAQAVLARDRRTVRHFSTDPVPQEAIASAIEIAGTAPSGAHRQPWFFVAISDPATKQRIREAAEAEERDFYENRAPKAWIDALAPLGTDFVKAHLTDAPWLIVAFRRDSEPGPDGQPLKNYYMTESLGIAVGFLI